MAHIDTESEREPSADDFGAAEKVLARLMPSLERGAPKYEEQRQALATHRAEVGKNTFDLRYGLRSPDNPAEQAEADFLQGRVNAEQLREVLKADAERPLDIEMLDAFHEAFEKRLMAYSRMLQAVIAIVTDQREPDAWRRREAEVDSHVEEMQKKLPLWKEQVGTIFAFMAELQAERKGEPVRCLDRLAESAHMLASRIMDHAIEAWRASKEIAHRSRTDPSYLYATSASNLFYESHLPGLPRAQDLQALMVLEYARARKALQEQGQSTKSAPPPPEALAVLQELRIRIEHDAKQAEANVKPRLVPGPQVTTQASPSEPATAQDGSSGAGGEAQEKEEAAANPGTEPKRIPLDLIEKEGLTYWVVDGKERVLPRGKTKQPEGLLPMGSKMLFEHFPDFIPHNTFRERFGTVNDDQYIRWRKNFKDRMKKAAGIQIEDDLIRGLRLSGIYVKAKKRLTQQD